MHCWGSKRVHGERTLVAGVWCLLALPHVTFPFADFASYPFSIMHFSCEDDYRRSSVSHPSEPLSLGWSWGTPNTPFLRTLFLFLLLFLLRYAGYPGISILLHESYHS